jgi:hypothetical protein
MGERQPRTNVFRHENGKFGREFLLRHLLKDRFFQLL